jgi:hypothetical protein
MKARFPGFKKCMAMMRKRDGLTREDGFHWLLSQAGEHVHELIEEYGKEDDIGLQCWFLELIGSAKESLDKAVLDFLAGELRAADERLRWWAIRALKNLGTKEARTLLWQARSYTFESPEDAEVFRSNLDAVSNKHHR